MKHKSHLWITCWSLFLSLWSVTKLMCFVKLLLIQVCELRSTCTDKAFHLHARKCLWDFFKPNIHHWRIFRIHHLTLLAMLANQAVLLFGNTNRVLVYFLLMEENVIIFLLSGNPLITVSAWVRSCWFTGDLNHCNDKKCWYPTTVHLLTKPCAHVHEFQWLQLSVERTAGRLLCCLDSYDVSDCVTYSETRDS